MKVEDILKKTQEIWVNEHLTLSEMIVRIGKVFGDICRWERNARKDILMHNEHELKKEIGNLIVMNIKFAHELGYDPGDCINLAIEAQRKYVSERNELQN